MSIQNISESHIYRRLQYENPWWDTGGIDTYYQQMYKRVYFTIFKQRLEQLPQGSVLLLAGPRRTGKTIMLYHTIQHLIEQGVSARKICYISIDTPVYAGFTLDRLVRTALEAMRENADGAYFIFNAISYLPNWNERLNELLNLFPQARFIAAGAIFQRWEKYQNEKLQYFVLPILSFYEYIELKDFEKPIEYKKNGEDVSDIEVLNKHFIDYLNYGGLPEIIHYQKLQADPERYIRNEILDHVLFSDLPILFEIKNIHEVNALFALLAYNTGEQTSTNELSRKTGINGAKVRRYLSYLESVELIKTVYPLGGRQNHFKIFITNPNLRTAVLAPVTSTSEKIKNVVATGIFSQWQHINNKPLYYIRLYAEDAGLVRLDSKTTIQWLTSMHFDNDEAQKAAKSTKLQEFLSRNNIKFPLFTTFDSSDTQLKGDYLYTFEPAAQYCYSIGRFIVESRLESNIENF